MDPETRTLLIAAAVVAVIVVALVVCERVVARRIERAESEAFWARSDEALRARAHAFRVAWDEAVTVAARLGRDRAERERAEGRRDIADIFRSDEAMRAGVDR